MAEGTRGDEKLLKIIDKKIEDLVPYENNPRKNDAAVESVVRSIEEFGFKVPIVIDKDNVIVAGHTRLKAAKKLGLSKVPCLVADDLTEDQIKAFRLVDNKTAEYAEWDFEKLEIELEALAGSFDMATFDFKLDKKAIDDNFNLEEALEEITDPVSKPGTVWRLGRHRLVCGDSTIKKNFALLMDGKMAHLTITDPPYNVDCQNAATGMKILNDNMDDIKFRSFLLDAFKCTMAAMDMGAPIYVFHAETEGFNFRAAFKEAGFKLSQSLVWVKNGMILGRNDYQWRHEPILYGWKTGSAHKWYGDRTNTSVIEDVKSINPAQMKKADLVSYIKALQERDYEGSTIIRQDKPTFSDLHPTMKPVRLIGKLMSNSSDLGDLVLDPFGGSGSTLIAAEQLDRACYMMELDPIYCDVIVRRWEEHTNQEAERIDGKA